MKYRVSDRGLILLAEKTGEMFSFLRQLAYTDVSERDKYELTRMLFTALSAQGVLDFNATMVKTFMTAKGNLIAIIPHERDYICANDTADFLLGEVQLYFDEFEYLKDKEVLDLCKTYLRLKPYLSIQGKKKLSNAVVFDGEYDRFARLTRGFTYKITFNDIERLIPYAEHFFKKDGAFYVKANPGVFLDDFYERVEIEEKEHQKNSTQNAVQKVNM